MLGIVDDATLERQLQRAALAFVSQHYTGGEFNLPSKLRNYMAYGLPVVAAVRPDSAVAAIVEDAKAGWITDSSRPDLFPHKVADVLRLPTDELVARGAAGQAYFERHFTSAAWGDRFDELLTEVAAAGHSHGASTD